MLYMTVFPGLPGAAGAGGDELLIELSCQVKVDVSGRDVDQWSIWKP